MDVTSFEEPVVVYPETEFERALTPLFEAGLRGCQTAVMVPKFGLDFAVFIQDGSRPSSLFLEVKAYGGQRQGGVGFGNGRGEGPQVEILLSAECNVLDQCVRWAFADATQMAGANRYAFLNCSEARAAVMGVVARGKQNNFKLSALRPHFVGWHQFVESVLRFFAAARGAAA